MNNSSAMNDSSKLNAEVSASINEQVFLPQITALVAERFPQDEVEFCLTYSDDSVQMVSRNGEWLEGMRYEGKQSGGAGYVSKTKTMYYSNSAQRDPILSEIARVEGIFSQFIFPVVVEGSVLGTIHLKSLDPARQYSEVEGQVISEVLVGLSHRLKNFKIYFLAKLLNDELARKLEKLGSDKGSFRTEYSVGQTESKKRVEIIGHDANVIHCINMAKKIAKEDIPVLIQGESGVGKRLFASMISTDSLRADRGIQTFECSIYDSREADQVLFGSRDRESFIAQANGSTLLLNDVSELSLDLQGKLVDFLTTGLISDKRTREKVALNVRIIATTRKSLYSLVKDGKFREDLFYRLSTVHLKVPALRDRKDDIVTLAEHFISLNPRNAKLLSDDAKSQLRAHSWSGNVLELRNVIERTCALSEGREILEVHFNSNDDRVEEDMTDGYDFGKLSLDELEKIHIEKTLKKLNGNKTRSAKLLGITVKTLYNKLHSYGMIEKQKNS